MLSLKKKGVLGVTIQEDECYKEREFRFSVIPSCYKKALICEVSD